MKRDAFSDYNPLIEFVFFICAVVMGMLFMHPIFVVCSFLCALLYYLLLKGASGLKAIGGMLVLWAIIAAINPLLNTRGHHVLTYIFGRAYTMESLLYGVTIGGMIASVLCWFACYNQAMSSEKFIYLFGPVMPSISLILSMILRLLPNFQRKAKQMSSAREAIGMAGNGSENKWEKIRNATVIAGALTGWALEGGIVTADSMKARGYGSVSKRGRYVRYEFDKRNWICLFVLVAFLVFIFTCYGKGGMHADFIPDLQLSWFGSFYMKWGHVAYVIFLIIPTFLNLKERIWWLLLRSKI